MAEQAWAKEPWGKRTHQYEIDAGVSERHCITDKNDKVIIPWPGWDNPEVDRIIACVNACAGVPTEVLELLQLADLLQTYPINMLGFMKSGWSWDQLTEIWPQLLEDDNNG